MNAKKSIKFVCRECSGNELGYQKYVKCITPVTIQEDGQMEYKSSIFDEDDYLAVSNGFCCKGCGHLLEHCGFRMETEKDIFNYFTMDPELREQEQQEYDEQLAVMLDEQECKVEALTDEVFDSL